MKKIRFLNYFFKDRFIILLFLSFLLLVLFFLLSLLLILSFSTVVPPFIWLVLTDINMSSISFSEMVHFIMKEMRFLTYHIHTYIHTPILTPPFLSHPPSPSFFQGGFTSLHRACEQNHPGIVGTLLDVGADPNTKSVCFSGGEMRGGGGGNED